MEAGYATLEASQQLKTLYTRTRSKEDLKLECYMSRLQARYAALPASFWTKSRESRDYGGSEGSVGWLELECYMRRLLARFVALPVSF